MKVFITRSSIREKRNDAIRLLQRPVDGMAGSTTAERLSGKSLNAGGHGMYLELCHALEPGTRVSIEMVPPGTDIGKGACKVRRGRVVWCRKLDTDGEFRYGAGIEVFEKVVRAEIPVLSLV